MRQDLKDFVTEKLNEMASAPSCCAEAKAAAKSWLDAVGGENEAEQTKKLIAELEADIMPVDGLIAFASSDAGLRVFGEEMAKNMVAHAKELKASGAAFCDCGACAPIKAILDRKAELI